MVRTAPQCSRAQPLCAQKPPVLKERASCPPLPPQPRPELTRTYGQLLSCGTGLWRRARVLIVGWPGLSADGPVDLSLIAGLFSFSIALARLGSVAPGPAPV